MKLNNNIIADNITINKKYIHITENDNTTITIDEGILININGNTFKTEKTIIDQNDLDSVNKYFKRGTDYYIYMVYDDNNNTQTEKYIISKSSTYPKNYNENNSRKIGGFHFGIVRKTDDLFFPLGTDNLRYGENWRSNVYEGIIPNSIWTLLHRPVSNPEGMVYLNNNLWGDIYLSSVSDYILQSKYNQYPITGSNKLNFYIANEMATAINKRLPSLLECYNAAKGSPMVPKNKEYAVIIPKTGENVSNVSSFNVMDLVGFVSKYTSEIQLPGIGVSPDKMLDNKINIFNDYDNSDTGKYINNIIPFSIFFGGLSSYTDIGKRTISIKKTSGSYSTTGIWLVSNSI